MTVARVSPTLRFKLGEKFLWLFAAEAAVLAIIPLSARPGWMPTLLLAQVGVMVLSLAAAWLFRHRAQPALAQVFFAFFALAAAVLVSTLFQGDLLRWAGLTTATPPGVAAAMFFQSLLRVLTVLALMKLSGASWGSLYLRAGDLRLCLAVGLPAFLIMAAGAFLFIARPAGFAGQLPALLPWVLVFVLCNGFTEELLYRGLLLKRFEPFLGARLSLLLTSLVFTLAHFQVGYVLNVLQFLLMTFLLALTWGRLTQKSGSLWGSALFHAGADCLIVFNIFASMVATA